MTIKHEGHPPHAAANQMPLELARNLAEQGAARLDAALALGTAPDARSTTLMGIFGASAVGVGGAVLGYVASAHLPSTPLVVAGSVTGVLLFVAALLTGVVARPTDFYVAGGDPSSLRAWSWTPDGLWRSEAEMLEATALRYAGHIKADIAVLESGNKLIHASLAVAAAAPLLGLVVFLGLRWWLSR